VKRLINDPPLTVGFDQAQQVGQEFQRHGAFHLGDGGVGTGGNAAETVIGM